MGFSGELSPASVYVSLLGSRWWLVRDIEIGFGPRGPEGPEGPFQRLPKTTKALPSRDGA